MLPRSGTPTTNESSPRSATRSLATRPSTKMRSGNARAKPGVRNSAELRVEHRTTRFQDEPTHRHHGCDVEGELRIDIAIETTAAVTDSRCVRTDTSLLFALCPSGHDAVVAQFATLRNLIERQAVTASR